MSLPINLPSGVAAVYGMGTMVSSVGLTQPEPNSPLRFGSIYQIYDGGQVFVYGGDEVMFDEKDVICRVVSENIPYTLVPVRLVTKQIIPL